MSVVLAVAVLVACVALVLVGVRGSRPPTTIEGRADHIASGLRCPVCQNLSVADSPSRLAQQMRSRIARDLEAGRTEEQIRAGFVAAYGDWILLEPRRSGIGLLAWILPIGLLIGGAVLAILAVRRWRAGPAESRRRAAMLAGTDAGEAPIQEPSELSQEDRRLLRRALFEEDR